MNKKKVFLFLLVKLIEVKTDPKFFYVLLDETRQVVLPVQCLYFTLVFLSVQV